MSQPLGVFDYTNENYHASEGVSRSKLWTFKQLPSKYHYEYLSGAYKRAVDSEAFVLGDLVHTMVLEPHLFADRYCLMPEMDRRTKAGKEAYQELMEASAGKTLIKPELFQMAKDMQSSVNDNNTVPDLLRDAKFEKSIYWQHEPTGLICKARPDAWNGRIVADLKTTKDASFRGFQSSAYTMGYFLQAAMIYEALKSIGEPFHTFVFICVEKQAPYSVGLYMLDDEALQFGIDMFHSLMEKLAQCYEKNVWPDYGIQKLTVPIYASMEVGGEQSQ